jgi:hypothetical protein
VNGTAPHFVFVGPSKSGSTWIFELLRSHPQVYVPIAKDIYFFDRYHSRGKRWYEAFFDSAAPGQIRGEVSHDYLSNPTALERLAAMYPSAKVICCLRNPYERAISSYRFFVRNGLVTGCLSDAMAEHPEILEEGLYADHLGKLMQLFPGNQILVLNFDELTNDPQHTARAVFAFLGVDPDFRSPLIGRKVNEAAQPRSRLAAWAVKQMAGLFRRLGFASVVGAVKRNALVKGMLYKKWADSPASREHEAFPCHVIEQYDSNITQLSRLLGKPFDSWRRGAKL